jgi:hypothetical protein
MQTFKSLLFLFAFLFSIHPAFSQNSADAEYIITTAADTLYGAIDYKKDDKDPDHIVFHPNEKGFKTSGQNAAIQRFYVGGDSYVRAIVKVEKSPDHSTDSKLNLVTDTVFLLVLAEGPKSLYCYTDKNKKENFYIYEDSTFQFLKYKKYERMVNGEVVTAEWKVFQDQLSAYLGDCETTASRATRARYVKSSLLKLFHQYYECRNLTGNLKKIERATVSWGIVAGYSTTNVDITSATFEHLDKTEFDPSSSAGGGIKMNLVMPKTRKMLIITNELLYSGYDVKGAYTDSESENVYSVYTTHFAYSYIKLNTLIQFDIPIKQFGIFIKTGVSNGFAVAQTNQSTEERVFYDQLVVKETKAIASARGYEQGFLLGGGIRYGRLSVEGRFESGDGMSKVAAINSKTKRTGFLVSYRIF